MYISESYAHMNIFMDTDFFFFLSFIQQTANLVNRLYALVSKNSLWCPKPVKEINAVRFTSDLFRIAQAICVIVNQDTNVLISIVGPGDFLH